LGEDRLRMTYRRPKPDLRTLTVAGIMSGTSADGIDVAITRIGPRGSKLGVRLLSHHAVKFPLVLRRAILAAMESTSTSTAELARLHWRLGIAYADAVRSAMERYPCRLDLIGCHGQTIYHQAKPGPYAGRTFACTWQVGEPALLATEFGVPVVSNFRPADMAAGGQAAPLVSLLDFVLYRHPTRARVLQNLGGIGNLTAIPAGASEGQVIAFDTGPGNMVIDACMQALFNKTFDRDGKVASRGRVITEVVEAILSQPFFRAAPPKSAGREQFGTAFVTEFLAACRAASVNSADTVATASALTAQSIAMAYERFVQPLFGSSPVDYILSGGGALNPTLRSMLATQLAPRGCKLSSTDDTGMPAQAKEAVAFALLAYQTWHHRAANVPSATGARRPVLLGQIQYV
jgi:anhydro-N-acetylmuramic acid kinase